MEKPRIKSRHQIELVSFITNKSVGSIRQYMYRSGLPFTTEGYAKYLEVWDRHDKLIDWLLDEVSGLREQVFRLESRLNKNKRKVW